MKKIDLLVIYPCHSTAIESVENIKCFHSMKAYFLNRSFNGLNQDLNIVPLFWPNYYTKSKNKFRDLQIQCEQQNINIDDVQNILFSSVCMFTFFKYGLGQLVEKIPGKIIKCEDHEGKPLYSEKLCTIGHFQKQLVPWNFVNGGLIVASDHFVPLQDWESKILKVHIDHNYLIQPNIFPKIKELLLTIQEKIVNHPDWNSLEIFYHDRQSSIDELGYFDFSHLSMPALAKIYGSCHIGIMSHRESLGMYPLEILSSGAILITDKNLLVAELRNEYPFKEIDDINLDLLLDKTMLMNDSLKNRNHIKKYHFDNYASKILDLL
jgi:hypothetical protein